MIKNYDVKIEQVIVLHLFNKKIVTLQGIGTFRLDPSVSVPGDIERDIVIPESAVSFEYNPKATEDVDLIDSIVQHTTKIKPLASADLDSFLMLGRQFLNIGKPFTLDRLGTLDKAQAGQLIFIPGQFITPKIEAPKALKENEYEESSGLFNDYQRKPENNNKKILVTIVVIAAIGLIGWALYHFLFSKNSNGEEKAENTQSATIIDSSFRQDSIRKAFIADSINRATAAPANNFKIVFKETNNKIDAQKSMNRLTNLGHHVNMYTSDSVNYKLAEIFQQPLSDTTRVKDSISKIYHRPLSVDLSSAP